MSEFQKEAVDRIIASLEGQSDREQKLLRHLEFRGRPVSGQKAWAQQAFGKNSTPSGTDYEAMKGVIKSGFVNKNKDGSITPTIRERVEEEINGYDVDRTCESVTRRDKST